MTPAKLKNRDGICHLCSGNTLADPKNETAVDRGQVLHISGASSADKQVSQNVKINQDSDVTFLLSGWGAQTRCRFTQRKTGRMSAFSA